MILTEKQQKISVSSYGKTDKCEYLLQVKKYFLLIKEE